MNDQNCIFCNIVNDKIPSATIFETSEFKVILDRFPASKGHVLILPKEHFEDIYEIDSETASKLFALATHLARVLKQELKCEGLNVVQNNGALAGQTVPHFHMHLIPRYEGDNINVNWKPLEVPMEELEVLAGKLNKGI